MEFYCVQEAKKIVFAYLTEIKVCTNIERTTRNDRPGTMLYSVFVLSYAIAIHIILYFENLPTQKINMLILGDIPDNQYSYLFLSYTHHIHLLKHRNRNNHL